MIKELAASQAEIEAIEKLEQQQLKDFHFLRVTGSTGNTVRTCSKLCEGTIRFITSELILTESFWLIFGS